MRQRIFLARRRTGIVPQRAGRDASQDGQTKGKIKPQGVRFRVYKITNGDEIGKEAFENEVLLYGGTKITWRVHLVNRKAAGRQFPPPLHSCSAKERQIQPGQVGSGAHIAINIREE